MTATPCATPRCIIHFNNNTKVEKVIEFTQTAKDKCLALAKRWAVFDCYQADIAKAFLALADTERDQPEDDVLGY